jgi:hypothetical protein
VIALAALPASGAQGARLIGGTQQKKVDKAFFARRAHKGQLIVSTRRSTVAPAWFVVKSVRPERGGRTTPKGRTPRLQSSYYHLVKRRLKIAKPPPPARADLSAPFRVAVVYSGSGSETITYHQLYRSVCPGAGGFSDGQRVTVKPMRWTVRYVVDLDALRSAVRGPAQTTLVTASSLQTTGSSVTATEILTRTAIDKGCNGQPTTFDCNASYALGPPSQGLLSFAASGGIEVGVPMSSNPSGDCDPSDFPLGSSLWDSGGTTAVVATLGLVGGSLPAKPYAPVAVSWPASSLALLTGTPASPCQGDTAACRDTFAWSGHVSLQNVS